MLNNSITSVRVDLKWQMVRIGYAHPDNPLEELCFEIRQGNCDLNILQDFLDACFRESFGNLSQARANHFCQKIYDMVVRIWLKSTTDVLLEQASHSLAM